MSRQLDLTQGVIWKRLLIFFMPILAGALFQQLYVTLDAFVVGQFAGKQGLAAIDSIWSLLKLPLNFMNGIATGATILISQLYGAKDQKMLSKTAHVAIALAAVGGLLFSAIAFIAAPKLLNMMSVPDDIYPLTLSYVRIFVCGLCMSLVYNVGAGMMRAVGDAKTPFYYLIIASSINFALDLVFVGWMKMSVTGAALSTVIGHTISAGLLVRALVKLESPVKINLREVRLSITEIMHILRIGLPLGLQSSLYPVANMTIQRSINMLGTDQIAAWALCGKLDFPIWLIADSLSAAISTFAAQNYGAGAYRRFRQGVMTGLSMTSIAVGAIGIVLYFFCEPLSRLFIRAQDHAIVPIVGQYMRFLAPLYVMYVIGEVLSGAIVGVGETFKPMLITLLCTCVFRILWILIVVPRNREMMTILYSYPLSWTLASICFALYYYAFQRRRLRI